jgi:hypothetical protein
MLVVPSLPLHSSYYLPAFSYWDTEVTLASKAEKKTSVIRSPAVLEAFGVWALCCQLLPESVPLLQSLGAHFQDLCQAVCMLTGTSCCCGKTLLQGWVRVLRALPSSCLPRFLDMLPSSGTRKQQP